MSYFRKGDPLDDFDRLDRAQAKRLAQLPKCDYCGKRIHDHYYEIDGDLICQECLDYHFKKEVEIDD